MDGPFGYMDIGVTSVQKKTTQYIMEIAVICEHYHKLRWDITILRNMNV